MGDYASVALFTMQTLRINAFSRMPRWVSMMASAKWKMNTKRAYASDGNIASFG